MSEEQYLRWIREVSDQEYNGAVDWQDRIMW